MLIWKATEEEIRQAAESVGLRIFGDYYRETENGALEVFRNGCERTGKTERSPFSVRLALGSEQVKPGSYKDSNGRRKNYPRRWQRSSASYFEAQKEEPRRIASVCWHGHYAFMRYLFELQPEARIKSAFADYRGLESFLDEAPETGFRNIGAPIYPVLMLEACFCEHYGSDDISELDHCAEFWGDSIGSRASAQREEAEAKRAADFLLVGRVNVDRERGV